MKKEEQELYDNLYDIVIQSNININNIYEILNKNREEKYYMKKINSPPNTHVKINRLIFGNNVILNSKNKKKVQTNLYPTKSILKKTMKPIMIGGEFKPRLFCDIGDNVSQCITFGSKIKNMNTFFEFDKLKNNPYIQMPIRKISGESENGVVHLITYSRGFKTSYSVLKTSQEPHFTKDDLVKEELYYPDNLIYEYLMGLFINQSANLYLPSFVYTYGLYRYDNKEIYNAIVNGMEVNNTPLFNYLTKITELQNIDFNDPTVFLKNDNSELFHSMCEESNQFCLLNQYLPNVKSLKSYLESREFILIDLIPVLFQVYMSIHTLNTHFGFVHNDLHHENILLYELSNNQHLNFVYSINGEVIQFKSKYVAKIIDYGRCYHKKFSSNYVWTFIDQSNCENKSLNVLNQKIIQEEEMFVYRNSLDDGNVAKYRPSFDLLLLQKIFTKLQHITKKIKKDKTNQNNDLLQYIEILNKTLLGPAKMEDMFFDDLLDSLGPIYDEHHELYRLNFIDEIEALHEIIGNVNDESASDYRTIYNDRAHFRMTHPNVHTVPHIFQILIQMIKQQTQVNNTVYRDEHCYGSFYIHDTLQKPMVFTINKQK